MTRCIIVNLGSTTTRTHCGNCMHAVRNYDREGCSIYGYGRLVGTRMESCLDAEDAHEIETEQK